MTVSINSKTDDKLNYEQLVIKHSSLVKKIAHHLASKMPHNIQIDDLIQSGMIGLLEAAKKYDVAKGASFETFSGIRIRGAMLDEIRRGDWGPRSVYRNSRRVTEAVRTIENRLGRYARNNEIASEMKIDMNDYFSILKDLRGCRLFSFEELFDSEESRLQAKAPEKGPHIKTQDDQFQDALSQAIDKLPEREQLVLMLYYDDEMNLKEIGKIINVSESRVSQIHSQATSRLKTLLHHWVT